MFKYIRVIVLQNVFIMSAELRLCSDQHYRQPNIRLGSGAAVHVTPIFLFGLEVHAEKYRQPAQWSCPIHSEVFTLIFKIM